LSGDRGQWHFQADRGLADKWYPYEERSACRLSRDPGCRRRGGHDAQRIRPSSTWRPRRRRGRPGAGVMQAATSLYLPRPASLARRVLLRAPDHHEQRPDPGVSGRDSQGLEDIEWPEFDYQQLSDLDRSGEIRSLGGNRAYRQQTKMRQQLDARRQRAMKR
jgi:hypothetical protein